MHSQIMRSALLAVTLLSTLTMTACATAQTPVAVNEPEVMQERLAFTDGLASEFRLNDSNKRKLQFFLSDTITLLRAGGQVEHAISGGRLISNAGRVSQEIVIPAGTPGKIVGAGDRWLAVSFAQAPSAFLYFVASPDNRVIPNGYSAEPFQTAGRYYLYSPNYDGQSGNVRFGNGDYIALGESFASHLQIERNTMDQSSGYRSVVPGRYVESYRPAAE
jgi:hypothetical protein